MNVLYTFNLDGDIKEIHNKYISSSLKELLYGNNIKLIIYSLLIIVREKINITISNKPKIITKLINYYYETDSDDTKESITICLTLFAHGSIIFLFSAYSIIIYVF